MSRDTEKGGSIAHQRRGSWQTGRLSVVGVAVNKLLIALGHSSITIKLIEYILVSSIALVINDLIHGVKMAAREQGRRHRPAWSASSPQWARCTWTSRSPPRLARSRRLSSPRRMWSRCAACRAALEFGATHRTRTHSVACIGLLAACGS